jgi:membrane-bound ClpP family serine protease
MHVGTDLPVSPLSPTVISTFLTGFGGGGLLAHSYLHLPVGAGVLVALGVGALLSGGTFLALGALFRTTQGGSEFSHADMVGSVVQVVTPIPENGTGEIALIAKGTRVNSPARSVDGSPLPRNVGVKIEKVVGNVFYVRRVD